MQELETVKSNDTTDVYSEVLKMFVGTDNLRPNIKQPFFNEDYVIATDAMVLICFKKELLKNVDFTPAENPPNALSIIPEDNIEPIVFETTALREAIKSLKEKTGKTYNIEESECPDCHGINFVTYKFKDSFGNQHLYDLECPVCEDGEGFFKIKNIITGETIEKSFRELLRFNETYFEVDKFESIVKAAELLSINQIVLTSRKYELSKHKFTLGECTVCIAPVRPLKEDIIENINPESE